MKKIWFPIVCKGFTFGRAVIKEKNGWLFEINGTKFAVQEEDSICGTYYNVTHLQSGVSLGYCVKSVRRAICRTYKDFDKIVNAGFNEIQSPAEIVERYRKYGSGLGLRGDNNG